MIEWACFAATAGFVVVLLFRTRFPRWLRVAFLVLFLLILLSGVLWQTRRLREVQAREKWSKVLPRAGRAGGYVSSDKCQACHPSQYSTWYATFQRTMTQVAEPENVIGFFDNVQLDIDSVTYRLQRRADQFWVEIFDWGRGAGKFETRPSSQVLHLQKRINLLTGSHHMQVCWVWSGNGNLQFILPFAYLIEAARWVPRDDTFLGQPTSNAGPAVEYSLHQLPYYRWAAASSGQFWQRGQPCG